MEPLTNIQILTYSKSKIDSSDEVGGTLVYNTSTMFLWIFSVESDFSVVEKVRLYRNEDVYV